MKRLTDLQRQTLYRLRAKAVSDAEGWEFVSLNVRSANSLVRRRLAERVPLRGASPGYRWAYRLTEAGHEAYERLPKEPYSYTCRICEESIEFLVAVGDWDVPDALRYTAGWSLTPSESPFDGNAYYYCPACHERTPEDA